MQVEPVVLEREGVRLEPLQQDHANGLYNRGRTAADWSYMPRACFIDLADTRHLNIRPEHRSLEIGWTWLGQEWQRTGMNTEAKLLLLTHAFERLGCVRVEFKTDARNLRSQRALERIGATPEGVMRNHMIVQGNYVRDSVYFSVIDRDWPAVRERLTLLRERS